MTDQKSTNKPKDHSQYMHLAIKEAKKGSRPYGTVIVDSEGKIIGRGHNTVHIDHDVTKHAELSAIREASRSLQSHKLDGCSLYATAEPCVMCMGACIYSRIAHVYFGASIYELEKRGYEQIKITDKQVASKSPWPIGVTGGVLKEECLNLYKK